MAAFKPPFYFAFSKVLFAVRIIFVEQENSADDDDTNGAEGNATIELTRLLGRRRDFHVGRLGDRKGRSGVRHRGSGNQRRYHQASNKKLQTHIKHPLRERIWTSLPLSLRSEEHTSELQSLMRISYAVFCLKQKKTKKIKENNTQKK